MEALIPLSTLLPAIIGIEPIVWTSKGNIPASALVYETSWEFDVDHQTALLSEIRFIEEYRAADGEVVKRSVHAYKNSGASAATVQGVF
jgi:hypothetical protein